MQRIPGFPWGHLLVGGRIQCWRHLLRAQHRPSKILALCVGPGSISYPVIGVWKAMERRCPRRKDGLWLLGVDAPGSGAGPRADSLLCTQVSSSFLILEPFSYFPTSSAIHANRFLGSFCFRGPEPGGWLWKRGSRCSQSLQCLFTVLVSAPAPAPCYFLLSLSPGIMALEWLLQLQCVEGPGGGQRGTRSCCRFKWPSGLCMLPPAPSSGLQSPNSTLCQPEGRTPGWAVSQRSSPAWVLLWLHLLVLGLGFDSVLSLGAQVPTPHSHTWVPAPPICLPPWGPDIICCITRSQCLPPTLGSWPWAGGLWLAAAC